MTQLTFPQRMTMEDWKVRHNTAVHNPATPGERAILYTAAALRAAVEHTGADPHSVTYIIEPMVAAFQNLLTYDAGRLDCGRLDDWVTHLAQEAGCS